MDIKLKIESWIRETLGVEGEINLSHPKDTKNGDFTFVVSSGDPGEIIEKLRAKLGPEVEKVELASGRFINIFLSKNFFSSSIEEVLKNKDFGKNNFLGQKKFMVEHSQPNPFKEFHIGHLMNNAIGESISRIVSWNGGEVKTSSYHGDVGLHVAKAIWAKIEKPEMSWGEAYAYGSENHEGHKEEIIEINKKIYSREDKEINKLYDQGRQESLDQFEKIYERLDSHFDFHFYESEAGEIGKRLVLENVGKIFEESDGAVIFRGEKFGLHTRVFLNSDKLPTYEAKEIGLASIKKEKYPFICSITITANEQDSFFKVVESALGQIFPDLEGKLKHISHGIMKLPSGKMSSRTGNIISADSLLDKVKEEILNKMDQSELSLGEKSEVSEAVSIAAIKYSILRQAVGGDIVFDFDKSISFEGSSGPYLQYSAVRANSVLEKAKSIGLEANAHLPEGWQITELERAIYRFGEIVSRSGAELSPHHIITYLTELAQTFNNFYAKEKIVDEKDPSSPYKLALAEAVYIVLKNGLFLLGIKVPERM